MRDYGIKLPDTIWFIWFYEQYFVWNEISRKPEGVSLMEETNNPADPGMIICGNAPP
jgi:hypothetical protein